MLLALRDTPELLVAGYSFIPLSCRVRAACVAAEFTRLSLHEEQSGQRLKLRLLRLQATAFSLCVYVCVVASVILLT